MRNFFLGVLTAFSLMSMGAVWLSTHQALVPAGGIVILSLPECPVDLNTVRIGFCYDPPSGRIKMRDGIGVRNL